MRGLLLVLMVLTQSASADIYVFTERDPAWFQGAAKTFEQKTGQKVVFVADNYNTLVKIIGSGQYPQTDLIITKDLVNLTDLKARKLLQPLVETDAVRSVRPFMRDTNWVGLTYRVRTVVFREGTPNADLLTSYESLGSPMWTGKLCMRSGRAAYNQALVASLLAVEGAEKGQVIVQNWVNNLAQDPIADDKKVLRALVEQSCNIGLVNSYYLAQKMREEGFDENSAHTYGLKIKFLDQSNGGVHSNGVIAGILAASTKKSEAQQFIDILLSPEVQLHITGIHMDYPAVQALTPSTLIKVWGEPNLNTTPWSQIADNVAAAKCVIVKTGYDNEGSPDCKQ